MPWHPKWHGLYETLFRCRAYIAHASITWPLISLTASFSFVRKLIKWRRLQIFVFLEKHQNFNETILSLWCCIASSIGTRLFFPSKKNKRSKCTTSSYLTKKKRRCDNIVLNVQRKNKIDRIEISCIQISVIKHSNQPKCLWHVSPDRNQGSLRVFGNRSLI